MFESRPSYTSAMVSGPCCMLSSSCCLHHAVFIPIAILYLLYTYRYYIPIAIIYLPLLYTYRYTVTTTVTPALRWAATTAILMFH